MAAKKEKWDCLFVDRVDKDNRIYLKSPQEYGAMYVSVNNPEKPQRVRNSIPNECGTLKGLSNENKFLKSIAIPTALNKDQIRNSNGLVVRGFIGGTPFATPETWIIKSPGIGLHLKDTTGWFAYVAPSLKFYTIINKRYKGNEIPKEQSDAIHGCIKDIENNWG